MNRHEAAEHELKRKPLIGRPAIEEAYTDWSLIQQRRETEALMLIVEQFRPQTIVEIGTAYGGSLRLWREFRPRKLIAIDLPGGVGSPNLERDEFYKRCRPKIREMPDVTLIETPSADPATVERVKEALDGEGIEFLFIDGDHAYPAVKADWEAYRPLLAPRSLVCFCDIVEPCEVSRLWAEIEGDKLEVCAREMAHFLGHSWAGYGLLFNL